MHDPNGFVFGLRNHAHLNRVCMKAWVDRVIKIDINHWFICMANYQMHWRFGVEPNLKCPNKHNCFQPTLQYPPADDSIIPHVPNLRTESYDILPSWIFQKSRKPSVSKDRLREFKPRLHATYREKVSPLAANNIFVRVPLSGITIKDAVRPRLVRLSVVNGRDGVTRGGTGGIWWRPMTIGGQPWLDQITPCP